MRRAMGHYAVVFSGLACRSMLQVALTIFVARALGRSDYGATVAVAGIAAFFSVWAGLGASALHLRDSATQSQLWQLSFAHHYSRTVRTQLPLIALALLVAWFVTRGAISGFELVLLVTGEMLGAPLADLLTRSYQGRSHYVAMAAATCALPFLRLGMTAFAVMVFAGDFNLSRWAVVVFASGAVVASAAWWTSHKIRRHAAQADTYQNGPVSGLAFAVAAASSRVHADVDKVILARLSSMGAAADYSLAYRIVDVLLLPVSSLIEWSARAMFLYGQSGTREAAERLSHRWIAVGALAGAAAFAILLLAPLLPWVFGVQYEGAETIARWLCLLPVTAACWLSVRGLAAASGHERLVAVVEGVGALLNAALCVVLIQAWEWRGAVLATYVTHIGMVLLTLHRIRKSGRPAAYRG